MAGCRVSGAARPGSACSMPPSSCSPPHSWRSVKVTDIARQARTSPATFYQYFANVEEAIRVLAEGMVDEAAQLAELVGGTGPKRPAGTRR